MRTALIALVLLALVRAAAAQEISARALLAFERYETNGASTSGFRQTYDLRLARALSDTARFRIFFRGDDFRGSSGGFASAPDASRQLQPGAELSLNLETLSFAARSEFFDLQSRSGRSESSRRIERTNGNLAWTPIGLPSLRLIGQRNRTVDDSSRTRLTDESAIASLAHEWHSLGFAAEERYTRSVDPGAGYDRGSRHHRGTLSYSVAPFGGRLTFLADASAQRTDLDETAAEGSEGSVPKPVMFARALYAVDETPLDSRDHPGVPTPSLNDGDLDRSAGISLGPDAASFQNITIDVARIDRVDEIRVVVRDPSGNPLRNGGGPVTFDAYASQDGEIWSRLDAATLFNAPLSLYVVAFPAVARRWLKIVNFGVNADATLVTEVQAFGHAKLRPGEHRRGDQTGYNGTATVTLRPLRQVLLSYTGLYTSLRQITADVETQTRDLEHLGSIEYAISRAWSVRSQFLDRQVQNFARTGDGARGVTTYLDYAPTRQLRITLEAGDQRQTIDGSSFTLERRAIHTSASIYRSLYVMLDGGTQTQKIARDGSIARQQYVNVTANAQLWPAVRLQANGSMQRARSESADPAVALLGPSRDNRISTDLSWRPGRQLLLSLRTGWVSGQQLSGMTQRYHVDWFPFGDGTVSLGGSYDEDIDPTLNRRATRMVFNPRWLMNRYATLDLHYTSVTSTFDSVSNARRTLFATLTLSR